jgi:dUTP pyrophosphatase
MFEKVSYGEWENCLMNEGSPCFGMVPQENMKEAYDEIIIPQRGTPGSAGYDFFMPFELQVEPGGRYLVPTGIKVDLRQAVFEVAKFGKISSNSLGKKDVQNNVAGIGIPSFLALYPRSSLGFNYGFNLLNTVGIIDQDYYNNPGNEGHIMVGFEIMAKTTLKPHSKFCQGIIQPFMLMDTKGIGSKLRIGGVGSTGI